MPIGNSKPDRPQSSHNPSYAYDAFESLSANWSLFRRMDSTIIVASATLHNEALDPSGETEFALSWTRDPKKPPRVVSQVVRDTIHVLTATLPGTPHLVSIEALNPDAGVAGRSRFGIDPSWLHDPGFVVSDVLMLRPLDSLPTNIEQAIPAVRLPHAFRAGERFVLYWELYGANSCGYIRNEHLTRQDEQRIVSTPGGAHTILHHTKLRFALHGTRIHKRPINPSYGHLP